MGFSDFDLEAFLASAEMQGGFKGLPKWCPGAAFGTKMSGKVVPRSAKMVSRSAKVVPRSGFLAVPVRSGIRSQNN